MALERAVKEEVEIATVVVPQADDRLAAAAKAAGIAVFAFDYPKFVLASAITYATNLIVAGHAHERVVPAALVRSRLGGIGYITPGFCRAILRRATRLPVPPTCNLFDIDQTFRVTRA